MAQDGRDRGGARVDIGIDPRWSISGASDGSLISAMAILQPIALARTEASMLVLSSSVTASTASARSTPASAATRCPARRRSARWCVPARRRRVRRRRGRDSITRTRIRSGRPPARGRHPARHCPADQHTRSCRGSGLPKISSVRASPRYRRDIDLIAGKKLVLRLGREEPPAAAHADDDGAQGRETVRSTPAAACSAPGSPHPATIPASRTRPSRNSCTSKVEGAAIRRSAAIDTSRSGLMMTSMGTCSVRKRSE
jgi:hypothetical protein